MEHETTWVAYYNYTGCESTRIASLFVAPKLILKTNSRSLPSDAEHRLYTISLYVSVVAMFGGVGSIVPMNFAEYILYTLMMVFGSFVWAYVIGSFCGILSTLNPHAVAFQNMMDELNLFMADLNFSTKHRIRLREFFRQTQDFFRSQEYDKLIAKMSAKLKTDTALLIAKHSLSRVWYLDLAHVENQYMSMVALKLQPAVYEAGEQLPVVDLTILVTGLAARQLLISTKNDVLGADCIIAEALKGLREPDPANCLTFVQASTPLDRSSSSSACVQQITAILPTATPSFLATGAQVASIGRSELWGIAEFFPCARAYLTHAAAIMALRGAFKKYFKWHKHETLERRMRHGMTMSNIRISQSKLDALLALPREDQDQDTDRRRAWTTMLHSVVVR